MNLSGRAVVIKNSPVEFAVSGPMRGRDRILVRSENAGLDLIGKAMHFDGYKDDVKPSTVLSQVLGAPTRLNSVVGGYVSDVGSDIDDRNSRVTFTWRGHATSRSAAEVHKAFFIFYKEIYAAYYYGDEDDVELQISPLIYQCSLANERFAHSRRMMKLLLGGYALIGLGATLWYALNFIRY